MTTTLISLRPNQSILRPSTAAIGSVPGATQASSRRRRRQSLAVYASSLLACLVIMFLTLKLQGVDLRVPMFYYADTHYFQVLIKGVVENGWYLDNPSVAAPLGLNMRDFPMADSLQFFLVKLIGIVARDHALTANLYFLLTFPLTTLTTLFVLRRLGCSYYGEHSVHVSALSHPARAAPVSCRLLPGASGGPDHAARFSRASTVLPRGCGPRPLELTQRPHVGSRAHRAVAVVGRRLLCVLCLLLPPGCRHQRFLASTSDLPAGVGHPGNRLGRPWFSGQLCAHLAPSPETRRQSLRGPAPAGAERIVRPQDRAALVAGGRASLTRSRSAQSHL